MKKLIASIALCQSAGIIGSFFTVSAIPVWYATLNKPNFSPPNWLFGPAWITLYTLMGIALYFVWRRGLDRKDVKFAFWFFVVHLFFNAFWSFFFFGFQNVGLALADIAIILAMAILSAKFFWSIDKKASYLMMPYIGWLIFASALSYSILALN